ncbi:Late embryogenesis abundant protein [Senna tora]|uniref:Late embryogenesis abundant protein n=1 Tax=Senna tora TaxID=362788 RepID=A0A834T3A3_9FABA|nr:Late embryogenesis abundant protein [Senna tora]
MHAKSDSDVTSYDPSSPRSPKRAAYYVQSPSRDSHDGDKSSSMQPTPACNSPIDSPLHQSYGHHSRASSASRVSGSYNFAWGKKGNRKRNDKGWPECKVIEEEGDFDDGGKGLLRRTQASLAVLGFVVIFTLFCLIIWGVSRPYKAQLRVKSLTVHNFYFGAGTDLTGVPTKMLTTNCSMKMTVYNPATFFGIRVSSKSVNLMYSDIAVATGELKKYHQQRKSHKTVSVNLQGNKVPLYGAGANLAGSVDNGEVPMKLDFEVNSRGNVVGKLVRSKHRRRVSCSVTINTHSNKPIKLQDNACIYD